MTQDLATYYVWIGGSCDYGHKERAGGAAVVIELMEQREQSGACSNYAESRQKKTEGQQNGKIISKDVIADLHTTEFRMMLTLMTKVMDELPEGSDILFLTNAAYIQNFDKAPTSKSANPDLIAQCIESKQRHNNVSVKIVQYHKSPLLIETHDASTEAMKKLRTQYNRQIKLSVTHCIMVIAMMLLCGCSGNSKTVAISNPEQTSDSTTQVLPASEFSTIGLQSTSSEVTVASEPSIYDELANNMVRVEKETGNFYICKFEVTQILWVAVMGDNPSGMQGDDLPVEQVNWNDCQRFIAKLNKLTGKDYRLPTEAEWEYACKGGKYSKGYKYSGSDDINKVAWYDGNSDNKSHPVGQKLPNELGLYDMSGNVWEWCQDMHEGTGMCRGGSWIHNARNCDPSLPNETPQAFYINSLGLRLAQ